MNPRFIEEMSWRMGEVYAAVTDQILINLARHFKYFTENNLPPGGAWQYQITKLAEMGQVTRETEQIILNMLGDADGALRSILENAIRDGLKDAEKPLKTAAERGLLNGQGFIPPEVEPGQMQAFRAFYNQSADKLNLVNTVMLESTQQAYQATVSDIVTRMSATQDILNVATGEVVTGVSSLNQAVRQGVQKMVENGITGFIDHGGHHWSPEAYVTMDVRTTMANTAREAVFERQEQYGNDLYQVSHHDGARPLCYPWQGKVISRADASREVEDDEGNKVHVYAQSETSYGEPAGLFGINCGHYPIPFIPGFSRIRPPEQNKEENDREYKLSQEQRQLERDLRAEKRDLAVLKAQGADKEEIRKQQERVKAARDNLNDFSERTGRARRTGREGTPVKASWPDGYEPPKPNLVIPSNAPNVPASTGISASTINPEAKSDLVTKRLPNSGIQAYDVTRWDHEPTMNEIISSVGGADQTRGSCASVALAYAGNKAGYDVHDFRGGDSMDFFATKLNTAELAKIPGIDGVIIHSEKEVATAQKLLGMMEEGKEYFLGTGRHASIVRKNGGNYEYLEMQSATDNGYHPLSELTLRYRFGCAKRRSYASNNRLISVDKLINSPDFAEVLKYINTPVGQQKKGAGGGIR